MYKILIKYDSNIKDNLWEVYGNSTTSSEFETNDISVLKEELIKLDQKIGFENIRVIEDKSVSFSVGVNTNTDESV